MHSCRLLGAGLEISPSGFLWKLTAMMLIVYLSIMGASAFTVRPEGRTGAERNCQFRGKHFKTTFSVEGEPVVLKCPQGLNWPRASASPHFNVTWRKNDSDVTVPGEETRVQVQDGALWVLPALLGDSGTYICTVRNASYCDEVSVELKIVEKTEASLPFISYPQILTLSTSGSLVCPELSGFTRNKTDLKIQWYKNSILLDQDNKKFLSMKGTPRLFVHNVSAEDAGYYSCRMTFVHRGAQYDVTRNIELRVNKIQPDHGANPVSPAARCAPPLPVGRWGVIPINAPVVPPRPVIVLIVRYRSGTPGGGQLTREPVLLEKEAETIPVIISPHQTILASLGSRLTIPCKVFLGAGTQATTMLFWMANNSDVEVVYRGGRVTQGQRQEYSENNENYIEVPLIFNPVLREDLNTDFKCEVFNTVGFQTLRTTVKEASTFAWEIALAPLSLVFLAFGGICVYRRCRHRTGKACGLTRLKTDYEHVQSSPSLIQEVK